MLLFFDPKLVSVPHFVTTYNASWRDERRPYTMYNSGLDGALYLNFYGGIDYLNELYYQMPDTHCTKPIRLAKGAKTKNAQACGTKYQTSLINSKKKTTRKAAKKSYCYNTPLPATEVYYQCRYGTNTCISKAIAEASGQAAIIAALLGMIVTTFAQLFMGLPKVEHGEKQKGLKAKGWGAKALMIAKKCTGTAKNDVEMELELTDLGKGANLTKEQILELLDANGDGELSRDEVGQGASKLGLTMSQAVRLFDKLDADGSGTLTMEKEATRLELTLPALAEELCHTQAALKKADKDRKADKESMEKILAQVAALQALVEDSPAGRKWRKMVGAGGAKNDTAAKVPALAEEPTEGLLSSTTLPMPTSSLFMGSPPGSTI